MDISKLSTLLDDLEIRVMVAGLAHVYPGHPTDTDGQRLRAALQQLTEAADPAQVTSWLSDHTPNLAMTVDQVRGVFGGEVIGDLATYTSGAPDQVAWQLTSLLPDLVDAVSPNGSVVDASELGRGLSAASEADDRSSGPFGPHIH